MSYHKKQSPALSRLCRILYGAGKVMDEENAMLKAGDMLSLNKEDAESERIKAERSADKWKHLYDTLVEQKSDDLKEALAMISELAIHPKVDMVDAERRMRVYGILLKHEMLKP